MKAILNRTDLIPASKNKSFDDITVKDFISPVKSRFSVNKTTFIMFDEVIFIDDDGRERRFKWKR